MWRSKLFLLAAFFSMALTSLTGGVVFAEDSIRISFSSNTVEFNLMPGEFGEKSQTITASTTSAAGYTIGIRTTGESSALTLWIAVIPFRHLLCQVGLIVFR